jgi:hypothetical protein
MSALLGLLATSVVTAIVGTALKGIIRPVSWALMAATLLLLGSVKVVEATNSVAENSPNPSPSETLVADSNLAGVPAAALGWQSVTSSLNPAFSSLYAQQPFNPRPSNPVPSPTAPLASTPPSPSADPNAFAQNPNPAVSPVSSPAAPARPIQALW